LSLYNKTEAIVLGQRDFGEADKIITLYTKEFGKLRAVAKGVRRVKSKFGSSTELFSHNDLMLYMQPKRDLYIITGSNIIRTHKELRENFDSFVTGSYVAELVDKLTEPEERNRHLFSLILETFHQIPKQDRDTIIAIFVTKFLANAGYKLDLEKCVFCEKPISPIQGKKLSVQQGGVLCSKCQSRDLQAMDVSSLALMYLKKFETVNLAEVGKIDIETSIRNELKRIVYFYLSHYLPSSLKTEEFMEKLSSSSKM